MSLLERIKTLVFGEDVPPPITDVRDLQNGTKPDDWDERATRQSVSSPADDPVMDDVAASGVQPVSKPWEIEEAQNPRRAPERRDT